MQEISSHAEIDYRNRLGIDSSAARYPLKVGNHVARSWFTMSERDAAVDVLRQVGIAGAVVAAILIAVNAFS